MKCKRCSNEVEKRERGYQPKFCSRACSNARSFSAETNKKRAESNRQRALEKTPEERAAQSKRGRDAKARKREEDLQYAIFDDLNIGLKRERVLKEQNGRCAECNGNSVWNGKPLNFHLDHVNGDRTNETRINLRLLCPNCHSQTDTYCRTKRLVTDFQLKEALEKSTSVLRALKQLGLQPCGKNYKRAKRVLADVG